MQYGVPLRLGGLMYCNELHMHCSLRYWYYQSFLHAGRDAPVAGWSNVLLCIAHTLLFVILVIPNLLKCRKGCPCGWVFSNVLQWIAHTLLSALLVIPNLICRKWCPYGWVVSSIAMNCTCTALCEIGNIKPSQLLEGMPLWVGGLMYCNEFLMHCSMWYWLY